MLVWISVTMMWALGTSAPEESFTMPRRTALSVWATRIAPGSKNKQTIRKYLRFLGILPPSCCLKDKFGEVYHWENVETSGGEGGRIVQRKMSMKKGTIR